MAKVFLIGIEQAAAGEICRALAVEKHQIRKQPHDSFTPGLLEADIVFAGGEPACYLPVLKHVRATRPALPFIVVTRSAETTEWLDALEAGATDYCSVPIEARQVHWLMASVPLSAWFQRRHLVGAR
jgi:DNA-binding NtrC family response regulator